MSGVLQEVFSGHDVEMNILIEDALWDATLETVTGDLHQTAAVSSVLAHFHREFLRDDELLVAALLPGYKPDLAGERDRQGGQRAPVPTEGPGLEVSKRRLRL